VSCAGKKTGVWVGQQGVKAVVAVGRGPIRADVAAILPPKWHKQLQKNIILYISFAIAVRCSFSFYFLNFFSQFFFYFMLSVQPKIMYEYCEKNHMYLG